jgi:hypothetical protein
MTVSFHTNWDSASTHTGTLIELFDPRVNRLHGAEGAVTFNDVRVSDVLYQLKAVYSLSAIEEHHQAFFPHRPNEPLEQPLLDILRAMAELGVLHYAAFIYANYRGEIRGYPPKGNDRDWGAPVYLYSPDASIRATSVAEFVATCTRELADHAEERAERVFGSAPVANIAWRVYQYMAGKNCFYFVRDGAYGSVTSLLGYASYSIEYNPQTYLYVSNVEVPEGSIRPVSRAHLYGLMGYNARATHYIAAKQVSTKLRDGKVVPAARDNLLYGIELELVTNHPVKKLIDSQECPFFICKQDSSITGKGANRIECVTVPMDYRGQRKAWGDFFSKFWDDARGEYEGFDLTTKTNNGMHIHMTKAAFTSKHLKRFVWMLVRPEHREFVLNLSERGNSFGSYAPMPVWSARYKSNRAKYDACLSSLPGRGAVALETSSGKTIEVRLFKGIVSYASLLKNLEFCDALYYYTLEMPYSKLTLEHFLTWLDSKNPPRNYKALKLFVKEASDLSRDKAISELRVKLAASKSIQDFPKALEGHEPSEQVLWLIDEYIDQLAFYPDRAYYCKDGWKTTRSSGSKLIDHEKNLNPFVFHPAKKAA